MRYYSLILLLAIVAGSSACSSRSAERVKEMRTDALIKENKEFIPLDSVIAESYSEQYNVISFAYKQRILTITYKHNEVWNAWAPAPENKDSLVGYFIPVRLINTAQP